MTTKSNLEGLTVREIKNQYPKGSYKSSMLKKDVIKAALGTIPAVKEKKSSTVTEPAYGRSR